ncbi:unnamed protein product [Chrysoparadoxa australica]
MPPIHHHGGTGPSPSHRLSLKDISPTSVGSASSTTPQSRDAPPSTSRSSNQRRHSFNKQVQGHIASQIKRFDSMSLAMPPDESRKDSLRKVLNHTATWSVVVALVAAHVALFILQATNVDDSRELPIWLLQMTMGILFMLELALRLYAFGLSYFSAWFQVFDAYVIVVCLCLTFVTPAAGALYCLRLLRVAQVLVTKRADVLEGSKDCPGEEDPDYNAPAVHLYKLLIRTVSSSCNVFTVEEKVFMRSLMYLLAHNQIYVDMGMKRGNAAYWKEYGFQSQTRRHSSVGADPNKLEGTVLRGHLGDSFLSSTLSCGDLLSSGEDSDLLKCLKKVDDWDFDAYELDTLSHGHPLVSLCNWLFDEHVYNFFQHFGLSKRHFTNYMLQIEAGYGSGFNSGEKGSKKVVANVYHNRRHAADVTQAVHYFMNVCQLGASLTDIEMVSLLFSAIVHDFKHPGRSNAFLIKTADNLSLMYNDISVLENYHVSEAFKVMRQDRCNFMRNVDASTTRSVRDTVIPLVLATDLKFHFDLLGEFNSHLSDIQTEIVEESRTRTYLSAMKICIKSADISHPTRAMYLHLKWTKAVIEEFFLQGDEEKRAGLEVSPLCDRDNVGIAKDQKGFINFLVKPLFKSWVTFLDTPHAQTCMNNLEVNEAMWEKKDKLQDDSLDLLPEGDDLVLPHGAPATKDGGVSPSTTSASEAAGQPPLSTSGIDALELDGDSVDGGVPRTASHSSLENC